MHAVRVSRVPRRHPGRKTVFHSFTASDRRLTKTPTTMTTGKPLVFTAIANTELTPMMRPASLKPSKRAATAPAAGDPALWRSLDGNSALYLLLLTLLQRNASLPDGRVAVAPTCCRRTEQARSGVVCV